MFDHEWNNASDTHRTEVIQAIKTLILQEDIEGLLKALARNPYAFFPTTGSQRSDSVLYLLLSKGSEHGLYDFFKACPAIIKSREISSDASHIIGHPLPFLKHTHTAGSSLQKSTNSASLAMPIDPPRSPAESSGDFKVFDALVKELRLVLPGQVYFPGLNMTRLLKGLFDNPQAGPSLSREAGRMLMEAHLGKNFRARSNWGDHDLQDTSFWVQAWLDASDALASNRENAKSFVQMGQEQLKKAWEEQVFFVIRKSHQDLLAQIHERDRDFSKADYLKELKFKAPSLMETKLQLTSQLEILYQAKAYAGTKKWVPTWLEDLSLLTDTFLSDAQLGIRMTMNDQKGPTLSVMEHLLSCLPIETLDCIKKDWTMDSPYGSLLESHLLQKVTAKPDSDHAPMDSPAKHQKSSSSRSGPLTL